MALELLAAETRGNQGNGGQPQTYFAIVKSGENIGCEPSRPGNLSMRTALKIGACICFLIAAHVTLFLSEQFHCASPFDDFIVVQKHMEGTDFCILAKQAEPNGSLGFGLNSTYSKSFYDLAQPGDHIRAPNLLGSHTSLVRAGHVIKSEFSADFIVLNFYVLCALFPVIIFVRFRSRLTKIILGIGVGKVELATVMFGIYLLHVFDS